MSTLDAQALLTVNRPSLQRSSAAARLQLERASLRGLAAYARRRAWSRTDTARWLNERSEAVLARLRRQGREAPGYSKQMGFWLKEVAASRATFDRAHERLAELANDGDRARANVLEVIK